MLRRDMRFWRVNQNQTFPQEFGGGYLRSPKRNKNGAPHQFYENMREVSPMLRHDGKIAAFEGRRRGALARRAKRVPHRERLSRARSVRLGFEQLPVALTRSRELRAPAHAGTIDELHGHVRLGQ